MNRIPYLLAILLAGGSLLGYLMGALVSRFSLDRVGRTSRSFNLGIPSTQDPEDLFAVSLAAAQTTFSTVFIVFLTDARTMGLHFLYCPIAFGFGNWLMLKVYNSVDQRGYVDSSSVSGLVPYLVYRFTKSHLLSYCVAAVCIVPIVGILALELTTESPI